MRRVQSVVLGVLFVAVVAPGAQGQTRGGFDTSGHLLMHGTPRFVLGVFDSGLGYAPDPAFWEDAIFSLTGPRGLRGFPLNVYLNYQLGAMPIGSTTALLDVLLNHGLMYLQTGNCHEDGSWMRLGPTGFSIASQSYVQQFAQHPAALGYYIMDECVDALINETQQHYQQLKAWDPQGISFAVTLAAAYRDPALWVNASDVLGIDPYPLYGPEPPTGYAHFIVADFTARVRAAAPATRPVWSVLQFFKFTDDSRMPTPGELRAHAVMAIVEGAQGIFWWEIGVGGLRQLDAATVSTYMSYLKTLTAELAGLEPALLAALSDGALVGNSTRFSDPVAGRISQLQHNIAVETLYTRIQADQAEIVALQAGDTSKSPLLAGAANVRTRTKVVTGVGYVFAYNYTNLPQAVTFTWQLAPTSVKESKSGQSFTLSGASWSDTFGPYEARIYVVNVPFDYTLANAGTISVTQGGSGATTITATLQGGTGQGVTLAASGLPSGATVSFSAGTCTPTCTSTLTISTSGSTPIGTVPITVTGSPFSKTTTFSLVVTAPTLTVAKAGTGSGTVTSRDGIINCGTTCFETVASGTSVSLTATPTSNSTFTSWSGCTSTRGTMCTVTVTAATTVTATFVLTTGVTLTVTILGSGAGTVMSIDHTINCGATCAAIYNPGTAVTLTATGSGSTFKQWGGACSGTVPTCAITLSASQSVTATFSESFTDGSGPNAALSTGSTVIKAAHILELWTAISNVRAVNGLGAFSWTDPTLTARSVVAKRIHFLDLRTALAAVCTALPGKCMTYTDATLSAGTVIKAVHLNELRANVRALE